jgi:TonB family protein
MKKLLVLVFMINATVLSGQRLFLNENRKPVIDSLTAKYYKIIEYGEKPETYKELFYFITGEKESEINYFKYPSSEKYVKEGKYYTWYKNGQLKEEDNYVNNKIQGRKTEWHETGQPKSEIDYFEGKLNGTVLTYWKNGKIKRKDFYNQDEFEDGTCYDSLGKKTKHFDYKIMPQYKGGDNQLLNEIALKTNFPEKLREAGIEGRVVVRFVVTEDGSITNVDIMEGVNPEFNNEAIRVVKKLKKFIPGYEDGDPVPVYYLLPITFTLR